MHSLQQMMTILPENNEHLNTTRFDKVNKKDARGLLLSLNT